MLAHNGKCELDIICGAPGIAAATGLDKRQVEHMLKRGLLRGAVKKQGRWFIIRKYLEANFRPDGELEIQVREMLDQMSPADRRDFLDYYEYWQ